MAISFVVQSGGIGFELRNKTETAIKIDWDQVSFVETDGTASKVVHSGVTVNRARQTTSAHHGPAGREDHRDYNSLEPDPL